MSNLQFYLDRAAQCRRDAEAATLDNVKATCLSAAAAWDNMAARLRKTEIYRANHAAEKAAQNEDSREPAPSLEK